MKEDRKCGYVCYFLFLLFLILLVLIIANDSDVKAWTEARQGMAGWAQFLGAMLTIVGSLLLVRLQIREDRKREEEKGIQDIKRRLDTLEVVVADELRQFEKILRRYDDFFERKYKIANTTGFYIPRPLAPPNLEQILKDSYVDMDFNKRNALKTILFYVPTLNGYADDIYESNRKRIFHRERQFVRNYMYTGIFYYFCLKCILDGTEAPLDSLNDEKILREVHAKLGLKTDIQYLIDGNWKWEKYEGEGLNLSKLKGSAPETSL